MRRTGYFIKCAFENIRLNRSLAFFSVITLTLTLMLFGLFLLFYYNVQSFITSIQQDVAFSVYLHEGISEDDLGRIRRSLAADERVLSSRYLSKDDALELFKKEFQGESLVQHLGANPLPASFEVNVKPPYQNPKAIEEMTTEISKFSGVEEVQYGAEWLKNFNDVLMLLKWSGLGIGGLLAVAVVTIIAHSVRLHFYDRREEVEIMKLIGATHRFIKNPFLLEGMMIGAVSGALSCGAIYGLFHLSNTHLTQMGGMLGKLMQLHFLPPRMIAGIVLTGALLGGIGGEASLTYLLRFRAKTLSKTHRRYQSSGMFLLLIVCLIGSMGTPAWGKEGEKQKTKKETTQKITKGSAKNTKNQGKAKETTKQNPETKEEVLILNKHIEKEKRELEQLEDAIREKKKEKQALQKQEESVLSTLETIDRRVRNLQEDAVSIEDQIRKKEKEIGYLSSALGVLDASIQDRRDMIMMRVRTLYQEGESGFLKVLIPSPDYPEFLRRMHYLKTIAEKETEMLVLFEDEQSQMKNQSNQLNKMKEQLVATREPLLVKLDEIGKEKERKRHLLTRVRNEKTYHEKTIAELDASSYQLKGLIEKLEEARRKMKEPAPSLGKFIQAKGKLDWPNDGSVVSLFGLQKHPKFNTDIFKKGIEIETSRGEDVKAVYDGSVIFSDWFKGYGMMIILDHGDNYYSVYAHLEKLLVSVGERAAKNRTIGSVGETGLSEGKRLYFEIRHQGEPMDPLSWLQKRG